MTTVLNNQVYLLACRDDNQHSSEACINQLIFTKCVQHIETCKIILNTNFTTCTIHWPWQLF